MHLITDENGNPISHGHDHHEAAHDHEHTHADGTTHTHPHSHENGEGHEHPHGHDHEHTHADGTTHSHPHDHASAGMDCASCSGGDCKNETVALLTYMQQHNEHHAAELDQMADNLKKLGLDTASKTIKEAVADFQKGNMRLALALTLVKEELK
jgi:hypothetical protein